MTRCPTRAELEDLLAKRLSEEREASFLAHVETCSVCQEALDQLTIPRTLGPTPVAAGDDVLPPEEPSPGHGEFPCRVVIV